MVSSIFYGCYLIVIKIVVSMVCVKPKIPVLTSVHSPGGTVKWGSGPSDQGFLDVTTTIFVGRRELTRVDRPPRPVWFRRVDGGR